MTLDEILNRYYTDDGYGVSEAIKEAHAAGVEAAARVVLLEDVDGLSPYTVAARIRALAGDAHAAKCAECRGIGIVPVISRYGDRLAGSSRPCSKCRALAGDAPKEQP